MGNIVRWLWICILSRLGQNPSPQEKRKRKLCVLLDDGKISEKYDTNRSRGGVKGALSGLRQFLATESPLKTMKNVFYFTSKALFVLKIYKFLS